MIRGINDISGKENVYEADYLPGAAFLCRVDAWKLINGMPVKYFLAYEEAEFSLRLRKAGMRSVVNTDAKIYHDVGMSGDARPMYLYNSMRNRIKLGKYLYGKVVGIFIGASNNLDILLRNECKKSKKLFFTYCRLWLYSTYHEIIGVPLSRDTVYRFK